MGVVSHLSVDIESAAEAKITGKIPMKFQEIQSNFSTQPEILIVK